MNMTNKQYDLLTKQSSPSSPKGKNGILAIVCGGGICVIGQARCELYMAWGAGETAARTWVSVTLVGITALLTATHLWSGFAKFAGAGAFVPITGFANSVVSPAIEFRSEGLVMGVGAKMFVVAGPVIVYGTLFSAVYGIILCIIQAVQGVM